jgi:GntR family transcriptional repressor for pyruvate dehydrogenase complex
MISTISKNTLVTDIIREISKMISDGVVKTGECLPSHKELASRFGVGVSTIREAVQALVAMGVVESRPGKGTWVREDTMNGLLNPAAIKARLGELNAVQFYEARFVIEIALTRFAAERANPMVAELRNDLVAFPKGIDTTKDIVDTWNGSFN